MKKSKKSIFNPYRDYYSDFESYSYNLWQILLIAAGVAAFVLPAVVKPGDRIIVIMYAASALLIGLTVILNAIQNFSSKRLFCESLFVICASALAFATERFNASVLILLLYHVIKFTETLLTSKEHLKADRILDILPEQAEIIEDGQTRVIKPSHIAEGQTILVKKGGIVPADGIVSDGMSSLDLSGLVHESRSDVVKKGDRVLSGSVNLDSDITVTADRDYKDSTVSRICDAFSDSADMSSHIERLLIRLFNYISPAMFCIAMILLLAKKPDSAAVALLAATPLGLINSANLSNFCGIERIFSSGAVIRTGTVVDKLYKSESFACNKTATVTNSFYKVLCVCPEGIDENSFMKVLLAAEAKSSGLISDAVFSYCGITDKSRFDVSDFAETPGKGVSCKVGDNSILAGNAAFLFDNGVETKIPELQGTAVHLSINGTYCGYTVLENKLRNSAYDAVVRLKAAGIRQTTLLSYDLWSVVRPVASTLGFDVVKGELDSEGKTSAVQYLMSNKAEGKTLLYAGDRLNESEFAAGADISCATDCLYTEGALDISDVCVLGGGMNRIPDVIINAKKSVRHALVSSGVSLGMRLILLILLCFGVNNIIVAASLLTACSVFSFLNSTILFDRY